MSHRPQLDSEILSILPENLEGKTILDYGMGYGTWGFLIRTRKNGYPYIVGTDLFKDYINRHRNLGIYNEVYQKDILNTGFEDGSFDIVLACEIIEHLDKPDGYKLLDEAERLSKELVIFSTPYEVINPRRISKTPFMDPNPLNEHVSKWVPQEFIKNGYHIKIVDFREMRRSVKLFDTFRRFIFGFSLQKGIIAWKEKNAPKNWSIELGDQELTIVETMTPSFEG